MSFVNILLPGEKSGKKFGMRSNIVQKNAGIKGAKNNMIIVYYDGKCGLCSKEIRHYMKIAPEGVFEWRDITKSDKAIKEEGISLVEGLKYLHAKDDKGKIHVGLDAFLLIWKKLKYWRLLGIFLSLPLIRQMCEIAYKMFARWRFQRLEHCRLAEKDEKP